MTDPAPAPISPIAYYERESAEFYIATGLMAPGKDVSALGSCPATFDERNSAWTIWCTARGILNGRLAMAEKERDHLRSDRDAWKRKEAETYERYCKITHTATELMTERDEYRAALAHISKLTEAAHWTHFVGVAIAALANHQSPIATGRGKQA